MQVGSVILNGSAIGHLPALKVVRQGQQHLVRWVGVWVVTHLPDGVVVNASRLRDFCRHSVRQRVPDLLKVHHVSFLC